MGKPSTPPITELLEQVRLGDRKARETVCEIVNSELRRAASRLVAGEAQVAGATSLVQEGYLRVFEDEGRLARVKNRRLFFFIYIDEMRRAMRERRRARKAYKRGGKIRQVPLDTVLDHVTDRFDAESPYDFEALDIALAKFEQDCQALLKEEPDLSRQLSLQYELLKLHYFAGMTVVDAADLLNTSRSTAHRYLDTGRARLIADYLSATDAEGQSTD